MPGVANVVTDFGADNTGETNAATAIQNAIDAADVIYVPPGVYQLQKTGIHSFSGIGYPYALKVPAGKRLVGEGAASTLLMTGIEGTTASADTNPTAYNDALATWYAAILVLEDAADVSIELLRFLGEGSDLSAGGTWFPNNLSAAIRFVYRTPGTRDCVIRRCIFEKQIGFAVEIPDSGTRHLITENLIRNCSNGLNANVSYSEISKNIFYHSEGLECTAEFSTFIGNVIDHGKGSAAITIGGNTSNTTGEGDPNLDYGCTVVGNTIEQPDGQGIAVGINVRDLVLANNVIRRSGRSGIVINNAPGTETKRVTVIGNRIVDAGANTEEASHRAGIHLGSASSCNVNGNTVTGGLQPGYDTMYGILANGGAGHVIVGNRLIGLSFKDVSLENCQDVRFQANWYDTAPGKVEFIGTTTFKPDPHNDTL